MSAPKITQAMIDAYNEYTHLTLDRRRFMDKLTKLTGSAAAAATAASLISANKAQAAMVAGDDPRIASQTIAYEGAMAPINGYLVKPAGQQGRLPGVVVIHENRGLNEHIRDVARRVALEGFVALAPDFLSEIGGTPGDEDKAREMIGQLEGGETTDNAVAAVAYLEGRGDTTGKIGAVGFCWGGGVTNQLAVHSPDLAAAVAYYGRQPRAEDVPAIKASLLLHYAGLDTFINPGIDAYREALKASGKDFTIYVYEGVNHAFNNDTSAARYDKKAADLAWGRTIAFLHEKLG